MEIYTLALSGGKKAVFPYYFTFFQNGTLQKVFTAYIGVQYIKLKLIKCPFKCKRNYFVLIKRYA